MRSQTAEEFLAREALLLPARAREFGADTCGGELAYARLRWGPLVWPGEPDG